MITGIVIALLAALAGCGSAVTTPTAGTGEEPLITTTLTPTSPASTLPGASYTFVVCGDNRTLGLESGVMDRIVAGAKEHNADFIVDTGDITNSGSRADLTRFRQYADDAGIKVYSVPGNHDVGNGGESADYDSIIGPTHYSFDHDGDHFIIVDNADDNTGIDAAQQQWISQDLAANAAKPHQFVFAHIPVSSPDLGSGHATGESGSAGLTSGQWLVSEVDKYANVSDLFFGHIHAYLAYNLDGKQAYVTGGGGAPLYLGGYFHYLVVHVNGTQVTVEVVRV